MWEFSSRDFDLRSFPPRYSTYTHTNNSKESNIRTSTTRLRALLSPTSHGGLLGLVLGASCKLHTGMKLLFDWSTRQPCNTKTATAVQGPIPALVICLSWLADVIQHVKLDVRTNFFLFGNLKETPFLETLR